jgi:LL-H family phage holin
VSIDQIAVDIILSLLVLILMIAIMELKQIKRSLPPEIAEAIDRLVRIAVKCVEQTSTGTSRQKKDAAITLIYSFCEAMRIPVPSHALIDAAIEACVYEIQQAKIPDEFFDGDKRMMNTGPIKPVLPPDPGGTPA